MTAIPQMKDMSLIQDNALSVRKHRVKEQQRRALFELFDKGMLPVEANKVLCREYPKSFRLCVVTVRSCYSRWQQVCKRTGAAPNKKNSHPSWVHELAFEVYCTASQEAGVIFRKLKRDIPNSAPALFTIYGWIKRWQALAGDPHSVTRVPRSKPVLIRQHKLLEFRCRRPGLPYIGEDLCRTWQTKWRFEDETDSQRDLHLRPCRDCGSWVERLSKI